jgi:hypothetical protein
MTFARLLLASVATTALLTVPMLAQAQTGPIGSTSKGSGPGPGPGMPAGPTMTPERLVTLLKSKGYQADLRTFADGGKTVIANIERDMWRYIVEFEFTKDLKLMHLVSPLGNPIQNLSGAQAIALLKKSYDIGPIYHFSYRNNDKHILLENPLWSTSNVSDQFFNQILDGHLDQIRKTIDVWDSSKF